MPRSSTRYLGAMYLEDIKTGSRVKSGHTGNLGTIRSVDTGPIDHDKRGWIIIDWDNGNISSHPFYDPDYGSNQAFSYIIVLEEK